MRETPSVTARESAFTDVHRFCRRQMEALSNKVRRQSVPKARLTPSLAEGGKGVCEQGGLTKSLPLEGKVARNRATDEV